MATAKVKVYPAVFVTQEGKVGSVASFSQPMKDQITQYNDFFIGLPAQEIEVEVPTEVQIRAACQVLLAQQAEALRQTAADFERKADQIGDQQ
jgi:hypothetical protein